MPHWALYLVCVIVPVAAVLLASREVRAWLRGTGSIRQTLSNAGVGLVFLLVQVALRGTLVAAFAGAAALVPYKLPTDAWWAWPLAFVLLDFVYYVQHRLEHAVPLLWAIHAVHHQSHDYNLSVSFRVGALSSISTLAFHSLLALAGVSASMYAVVVTLHAALLFTLHAKTKWTIGPGRFFNAPVFHRVHHGAESAYVDKNFGGVLLVFDRLFGTFAPYVEEPSFGVIGERDVADHGPVSANVAPFESLAASVRRQPTLAKKLRALLVRDA
ncbi:MAG: sterol desaturase family protein [Deltaproteobacteria bacterium]|nr:sterol desaturase family protein [Deltaproteobacteria bacterium]